MARPPAPAISLTVPAHAASSRSRTPTAIPSAASRRAVAAPSPRAAPVTIAIRSVTRFSLLSKRPGVSVQVGDTAYRGDVHGTQPSYSLVRHDRRGMRHPPGHSLADLARELCTSHACPVLPLGLMP